MSRMLVTVLLVAAPAAFAFDADLAPFLEKRSAPTDPEVPVVKPVDPHAPFPKLPPVEAMLNTSAHTVSEIVQEVTKIQARVHNVEQQDQVKLAQKKSEFEAQLKDQEQDTRDVITENAAIVGRITALQKGNQALRDASKNLQAENQAMRAELRSTATKVTAAGDFIKSSEKSTDDRHAKVLAVLSEGAKHGRRQPSAPVSTDSEDAAEDQENPQNEDAVSNVADSSDVADAAPKGLVRIFGHRSKASGKAARKARDEAKEKDDDDDDEDDADDDKEDDKDESKDDGVESFMQMTTEKYEESESEEAQESDSEEARSESAEDSVAPIGHHGFHHKNKGPSGVPVDGASKSMLSAVSQELKDLAAEDEQSLEHETQMFQAESAQEHRSFKAALAQQHALNKTEASLLTMQSKLRRAVAHLQGTKAHLQQRVRGVGQYLQHLAHLLLAPDKEAAGLIDSMPQDVPIPAAVPEPEPAATQPASTLSTGAALLQHLPIQAVKK